MGNRYVSTMLCEHHEYTCLIIRIIKRRALKEVLHEPCQTFVIFVAICWIITFMLLLLLLLLFIIDIRIYIKKEKNANLSDKTHIL